MAEKATGKDRIVLRCAPEFKQRFRGKCEDLGHTEQWVGLRLIEIWLAFSNDDDRRALLAQGVRKAGPFRGERPQEPDRPPVGRGRP